MADKMSTANIKAMAMTELGNWIEKGTAKRGWYTCEMTGVKMRGDEAIAQLDLQEETMQSILEQLQAEATEEAKAEDAEDQAAMEAAMEAKAQEMLVEVQNIEAFEGFTERLADHVALSGGKGIRLVEIKCQDCTSMRTIKVQDQFQVTRCVVCQKKHRNKIRAERRRQKRLEAKATEKSE
jgi:hypothetical protein